MPDQDGYPTDDELQRVRDWPADDPKGWMKYIRTIWHLADWGFHDKGDEWRVSTGGWSGNEEIIRVMQDTDLWFRVWESTRRGGHYIFRDHYPKTKK